MSLDVIGISALPLPSFLDEGAQEAAPDRAPALEVIEGDAAGETAVIPEEVVAPAEVAQEETNLEKEMAAEDEAVAASEDLESAHVLPEKAAGESAAPATLLGVYQQFCKMGLRSPGAIRLASQDVRDAVVKLYQPLVEKQPPAPFHPERKVDLKAPNCKDPAWRQLLDGSRRETPRVLVDVTTGMGGGPELDLLELRLWEINASLGKSDGKPVMQDVYVVVESAYGLRGDLKPLHFTRQRERFKSFLPQIEHINLDNCSNYLRQVTKLRGETNKKKKKGGKMFSAEGVQRICVLKEVVKRRPDIPEDALLIFSDLDEVPSAKAIQMLRVCRTRKEAKDGPWLQGHHPMPYSLRVGCKKPGLVQLHYQGVFTTMGYLRRKKNLALRYNKAKNLVVPHSGIHLTYVGSKADVDYKLLHHGESGQVSATKATAKDKKRMNFCEIDATKMEAMEALMRDNPVSVARAWERKSSVLKPSPAGDLTQCQVPWALMAHPERYPDLWGVQPK